MSAEDKREVIRLINEWNSSRYELFALSQPNEHLEFHGVMRFYFQDAGEKVSTKCVRVDSTAGTDDVIKVLIEKFRPDMKSLSSPKDYAIYEVHSDAQERKLEPNERPLWIQLDWGKDGREGRFLLKNENAKTVQFDTTGDGLALVREKKRMSKRDKKKQQKKLKEAAKENKGNVAEHLYKEVPDSNFTRSISNPEIVMARRRKQKIENKLKQMKDRDGGGTLKVFGETLKPDIPYKTLLISYKETAAFAVKETLEKYGLPNEEPDNYCLVQVVKPTREEREKQGTHIKEYILEDSACPLAILMKHPSNGGEIFFQIRRCTPDILAIRKAKKKAEQERESKLQAIQSHSNIQTHPQQQQQKMTVDSIPDRHQQGRNSFNNMNMQHQMDSNNELANNSSMNSSTHQQMQQSRSMNNQSLNSHDNSHNQRPVPYLIELSHEGFDVKSARVFQIKSDFYDIGNDKFMSSNHTANYIRIDSNAPGIEKKHCSIKKSPDNLLVVIPYAELYINDRLCKEPTQLLNNFTIRFGKHCLFRVEIPNELNEASNSFNGGNKQVAGLQNNSNHVNGNTNANANIPANYGTLYDNGQINEASNFNENANKIAMQQKQPPQQTKPSEGLPGLLEFPDDGEDSLLAQICAQNHSQLSMLQFKLAPVYTMYMMLRFRLSQKYKANLDFNDKLQSSGLLIHKMVNFIREAIDTNHLDKHILPYWLANSSELLYFLKQDVHLSQISYDAQELLADCVQITFKYLVNIMQQMLDFVLVAFFDPSDHVEDLSAEAPEVSTQDIENGTVRPTLKQIIQVLNETMNLLRGSRVNAALTIQLFSQLFHYVSMWLFNKLIKDQRSGLCSKYWGAKLTRRLNKIQVWAEKQGLELAADCHLSRIIQAAFFLQASKHDSQDLSLISSSCYALNSLQVKCLLKNYMQAPNELPLSVELCNNLVSVAENTADQVLLQEGRNLQLEEEVDLQLPFLLPEDGHSCDIIKGLPTGLLDFLEALQNAGHCWLWQNTQGPGSWKKFMLKDQVAVNQNPTPLPAPGPVQAQTPVNTNNQQVSKPVQQTPELASGTNLGTTGKTQNGLLSQIINPAVMNEYPNNIAQQNGVNVQNNNQVPPKNTNGPSVVKVKLNKKNGGLGLSIVAARGTNQINTGIYIKSVVPNGAASDDGRLAAGDQLLAVDEASLVNVTQERAAELMCKSGPIVTLTVGKEAAYFHDLDAILNKSPLPQQSMHAQQQTNQVKPNIAAVSMPLLNKNFNQGGMSQNTNQQQNNQQQNNHQQQFSSVTLPRNHLNHQNQFNNNSQQNNQSPIQSQQLHNFTNSNENGGNGYRTRSMSQELLKTESSPAQQSSGPAKPYRPTPTSAHVVTSPTHQIAQFRTLPNEQMRFGSERPVSMHNHHQQQRMHAFQNGSSQSEGLNRNNTYLAQSNISHRSLSNELGPRYGSERPSSHHFGQQQHHNFNGVASPIKPMKMRQASLNELEEINYNNQQNQLQKPPQQQQQKTQKMNQQPNRFDDLYGRVNPNRHSATHLQMPANQSQSAQHQLANDQSYKTLPSRMNQQQQNHHTMVANSQLNGLPEAHSSLDEQQRTKSHGQLYEHIWASNHNGRTNNQNNRQHLVNSNSIDELNIKNLEISGGQANMNNNQSQKSNSNVLIEKSLNQISTHQQQHQQQQSNFDVTDNNNFRNNGKMVSSTSALMSNSRVFHANNINNRHGPSNGRIIHRLNSDQNVEQQDFNQPGGRNYENQLVNNMPAQQQCQKQQQPHQGLMKTSQIKPSVPNKPFNMNNPRLNPHHDNFSGNEKESVPVQTTPQMANVISTAKATNVLNGNQNGFHNGHRAGLENLNGFQTANQNGFQNDHHNTHQNGFQNDHHNRKDEDENAMRLDILRQRMELLEQLESKPQGYRTNDEENRINNLKTEIEFDKRVIYMNQANNQNALPNGHSAETNEEEYDQDYTPEVRERINAQMRSEQMQRRRMLDEQEQMENQKNLQEMMAREEQRLQKHTEMNGSNQKQVSNSSLNFRGFQNGMDNNQEPQMECELVGCNPNIQLIRPKKNVQFVQEAEIMSPKFSSPPSSQMSSSSNLKSSPPDINDFMTTPPNNTHKRIILGDNSNDMGLNFERHDLDDDSQNNLTNTPGVIGANEIYVDQRLKKKQESEQLKAGVCAIEGEKLSFKEKMKLFAKQAGENHIYDTEHKYKVSRKQREIESKFEAAK